jgi:hypothetical protein
MKDEQGQKANVSVLITVKILVVTVMFVLLATVMDGFVHPRTHAKKYQPYLVDPVSHRRFRYGMFTGERLYLDNSTSSPNREADPDHPPPTSHPCDATDDPAMMGFTGTYRCYDFFYDPSIGKRVSSSDLHDRSHWINSGPRWNILHPFSR